jgi:thymidylate synthase (FAD)
VRARDVLDHGVVELLDLMPADGNLIKAVADTARVSYAGGTTRTSTDAGLVEYLLLHGHVSPFDQVKFKFLVKCPRFVRDQWYRHWSWDYDEESARYSEVAEEYYVPDHLRVNDAKNKQATSKLVEDPAMALALLQDTSQRSYEAYKELLGDLEKGEVGVAREQARLVLPHSMYTTFRATCSLRDLGFFLRQRLDTLAQWEIRQYAAAIRDILAGVDTEMLDLLDNHVIGSTTMSSRIARWVWSELAMDDELDDTMKDAGLTRRERAWVQDQVAGVVGGG